MSRKQRLELRLDPDIVERVRSLAKESGLSMNQLLEGVVAWASMCGHVGRPRYEDVNAALVVETEPEAGVLWFGDEGWLIDEETGDKIQPNGDSVVHLLLDFTPRRAVVLGDRDVEGNPRVS